MNERFRVAFGIVAISVVWGLAGASISGEIGYKRGLANAPWTLRIAPNTGPNTVTGCDFSNPEGLAAVRGEECSITIRNTPLKPGQDFAKFVEDLNVIMASETAPNPNPAPVPAGTSARVEWKTGIWHVLECFDQYGRSFKPRGNDCLLSDAP